MTASPTAFFAENANKSDGEAPATHAKNAQVQPASAAVPSEEDVARAIASFRKHVRPDSKIPEVLPSEMAQAAAVLALFAPLLAEKEREIAELKTAEGAAKTWCRSKGMDPMFHWDGRKTWQDVGLIPITLEEVKAALAEEEDDHRKTEARALAAEAALAKAIVFELGERHYVESRSDGAWVIKNDGCVLNADGCWEYEPSPSNRTDEFIARTRFDRDDAFRRAAAIRAQGE